MSDLQGAEFAPSVVVGYVTETGGFYATLDAVPMITLHNGERVKVPYVEAVRQLSCDDPDDMRAICRLASTKLHATLDESLTARFEIVNDHWTLMVTPSTSESLGSGDLWLHSERWLASTWMRATAALCAHVWGPK